MRIAVAQHASPGGEAAVVVPVVRAALEGGADLVICPAVPYAVSGALGAALDRVVETSSATHLLPVIEDPPHGSVSMVRIEGHFGDMGEVAVFVGDACFDSGQWERVRSGGVKAAVLCPLSESELQAEAALEVAIALSDSLCGLVVVAEAAGAEVGEPGHGGSAVIVLGDVVVEGFTGPDAVVGEVLLPLTGPEPPDPLPTVPPLIAQRLAHHQGRRLRVDWPADLSEGTTAR